ncbi:hypothetical protein GW17_00012750 [Ensete ventricosum]|nr:hypothetical protein GW17_00012750 [Ensete ventricosum]
MLCEANKIEISMKKTQDLSPEVSSTCGPSPIAKSYVVASTSGCLSSAPANELQDTHCSPPQVQNDASGIIKEGAFRRYKCCCCSSRKAGLNYYVQESFVSSTNTRHAVIYKNVGGRRRSSASVLEAKGLSYQRRGVRGTGGNDRNKRTCY